MIKKKVLFENTKSTSANRCYLDREEYVFLRLLHLLTLGDPSTGEVLRGDTALEGRSKTATLATRRKGSTRVSDLARLILVDGADDELEEVGVGDSVENGKEDCRI